MCSPGVTNRQGRRDLSNIVQGGVFVASDRSWNIRLPQDLVDAIRRLSGDQPEVFVIEAVRQEIQRRDQAAAIREAAGAWKNHEEIPDTVEELVDFMRRLRTGAARVPH